VYDLADLYKTEVTIPLAFRLAAASGKDIGRRVRAACRQAFKEHRLLKRLLPDIELVLDVPPNLLQAGEEADSDPARPEPWWSPPPPAILPPEAMPLEAEEEIDGRNDP
jgi:hypothetical protein